jgi:hypothetical protein
MNEAWVWIAANQTTLIAIGIGVAGIVGAYMRARANGQTATARGEALDLVVGAVEQLGAAEVKKLVSQKSVYRTEAARDALETAIGDQPKGG